MMAAVLKLVCLAVVFTASKQQGTNTLDFHIERFTLTGHYKNWGRTYSPACSSTVTTVCYVEEGHLLHMECTAGGLTPSLVTVKKFAYDRDPQTLPSMMIEDRTVLAIERVTDESNMPIYYVCEATGPEHSAAGIRPEFKNRTIQLEVLHKDDLLAAPFSISKFTIMGKFRETNDEGRAREITYRPRQSENGVDVEIPLGHEYTIDCRSNGDPNLIITLYRNGRRVVFSSGMGYVMYTHRTKISDSYNSAEEYRCVAWKWPVGMESYMGLERWIYVNVTQDSGLQPDQQPFDVDAFFVEFENGTTWTLASPHFSFGIIPGFRVELYQFFRIKCRSKGYPQPYLAMKRNRPSEPDVWRRMKRTYYARYLEKYSAASQGKEGVYKCMAWSPPSSLSSYPRKSKLLYLWVG